MSGTDSNEVVTRIGEIKTRLTDQSSTGLVTRGYLDEKLKPLTGKSSGAGAEKKEESKKEEKPGWLDQLLEISGIKAVVDAFKSSGVLSGLGAAIGVLGIKLIVWDKAFTAVLEKMKLKLDTNAFGMPSVSRITQPEAGSQTEKLQKLNEAAEQLTASLRVLTTAMNTAESSAA